MNQEQVHRIEAYRDLRQRLISTRAREQWRLEQARDRRRRAEASKQTARLGMLSEIIKTVEDLAGL